MHIIQISSPLSHGIAKLLYSFVKFLGELWIELDPGLWKQVLDIADIHLKGDDDA